MGRSLFDKALGVTAVGSLIALLFCGLAISRPNFHGAKFEKGICGLTTRNVDVKKASLIRCNCSTDEEDETCYNFYPCINARGVFYRNGSAENATEGTFHYGFSEVSAGCLIVPACLDDYASNEAQVQSYWNRFYSLLEDKTYFECWGYETNFYLSMDYSLAKAYMGVFIPTGLFFICVIVGVIFGDDLWRKVFCYPCLSLCKCNRKSQIRRRNLNSNSADCLEFAER